MADANIYDLIVEREETVEQLLEGARRSLLLLVSIALLEEELAKVQPLEKRQAIARVPRERVADGAFIFGPGRFGSSRFGPGDVYEHVRGESSSHVADALAAETARNDGLILVTHDRRLWKRATEAGTSVINFPALVRLLEELLRLP